jgi:hypothetical protein
MSSVQGVAARVVANGRHLSPLGCGDSSAGYPCGFEITGHLEDVAESDHRGASIGDCTCHDAVALVTGKHADLLVFKERTTEEAAAAIIGFRRTPV